ncbi:hypothetical protein STEG23_013847, partial [Scotinomys teguina]
CRASDTSDHGSVPLLAASGETVSDTTVVTFPASEGPPGGPLHARILNRIYPQQAPAHLTTHHAIYQQQLYLFH